LTLNKKIIKARRSLNLQYTNSFAYKKTGRYFEPKQIIKYVLFFVRLTSITLSLSTKNIKWKLSEYCIYKTLIFYFIEECYICTIDFLNDKYKR